jgi:hypothetical protein
MGQEPPSCILYQRPAVKFQQFSFGQIRIDGIEYGYDVVIDRGEIRKRKKKPSKKFRDNLRRTRFSAIRDERDRTNEPRKALSSKQIPKLARMNDENCSPLSIVSKLYSGPKRLRSVRIQRVRSWRDGGISPIGGGAWLFRISNEFIGPTEYLRTTTGLIWLWKRKLLR